MKKAKRTKIKKRARAVERTEFTRMQKGNVPDQGVRAPPPVYAIPRQQGRGR